MLLPFKKMCEQRKVHVDVVVIESDDVATAVAEEVAKAATTKLVVGASSGGLFKSKHKGMSAKISVCTPRFCTVYAVSKGKLSIRPSDMQIDESIVDDPSEISFSSTSSSSNYTSTTQTESGSVGSYAALQSSSLATQRFQALSNINQALLSTTPGLHETNHSRGQSIDLGRTSDIDRALSRVSSCRSVVSDTESWIYDQISSKDVPPATKLPSPNRQENFNLELEKLRVELRHAQGMHAVAQSENIDASRKLNELSKKRSEESTKVKEIIAKEETAKELARQEREKYEAATREAEYLKECAEREAAERKETELKAIRAAKEKDKLEDALSGSTPQYRKFTWDEIVLATSSFSEDLKIGMGAYGIVYKCTLYHTTVAVKALRSNENCKSKQFQQEIHWNGDAGQLDLNGTYYKLLQCHWHTPSEHTLNGAKFDVELHAVHQSSDGGRAVIGVWYKIGKPDPFLSKLLESIKSIGEKEIDVGEINPRDLKFGSKKYYRYVGSLTTPPCAEGVIWTVVKKVKTVSEEQIKALKEAVHPGFEVNARPTQVLNGRQAWLYTEKKDIKTEM